MASIHLLAMQLLDTAWFFGKCYIIGKVCKLVLYGISHTMLLQSAFGKPREASEMARAVDLILAKPGLAKMKSRSTFMCEGYIHHWTNPIQSSLAPLLEGYQAGLRTGDTESAAFNRELFVCGPLLFETPPLTNLYSVCFRAGHLYYSGRPLGGLLNEIKTSITVMTQLKQDQARVFMMPSLASVKKLRGDTSIDEKEMDLVGITKFAMETGNQLLLAQTYVNRLELNVFFQEWEAAASLLFEAGDIRKILPELTAVCRFTFFEALISIHAAQVTPATWLKRRKWKRRAVKAMKFIRGWIKKGNVNLVHSLHLLEAELAALDGKREKAENSYKAAITVASRNGFIQDRALAHELTSAYFSKKGDEYWKDYHMEQCLECYLNWGATTKVEVLRNNL